VGKSILLNSTASSAQGDMVEKQSIDQETNIMDCCAHNTEPIPANTAESGSVATIQQKFLDFLQAANAPGTLDGKTKRAIAIALSVLARCEPCVKNHLKKARDEGMTQEEIDEAAWVAISFGGSPTMAFYQGLRKS
jgi:AhpD family alkylhydroperoxidase